MRMAAARKESFFKIFNAVDLTVGAGV